MSASNDDNFVFRPATADDLPVLYALAKTADENGRVSQADLRRWLKLHPAGQWLIECDGQAVAAIHSLRTSSFDALDGAQAQTLSEHHDPEGEIAIVLAWAVDPNAPDGATGHLFEEALKSLRTAPGIRRILAVVSCEGGVLLPEPSDSVVPQWDGCNATLDVLRALGAQIVRRMPAYRRKMASHRGCAVLLDCLLDNAREPISLDRSSGLFVLSALSAERLRAYAAKVLAWLEARSFHASTGESFADALYTWQSGRMAMKQRLALEVRDADDLRERLGAWLEGTPIQPGAWSTETLQAVDEAAPAPEGLAAIASAWVAGGEVEWPPLRTAHGGAPRRIELPTYPFAPTRHWVPGEAAPMVPSTSIDARDVAGVLQLVPRWESQTVAEAIATAPDAPPYGHLETKPQRLILISGFSHIAPESMRVSLHDVDYRCLPLPNDDAAATFTETLQTAIAALREACDRSRRSPLLVQVVVEDGERAWQVSGLSGLLRAVAEEYSNVAGQLVLTDASDMADITAQLDAEVRHSDTAIVRYCAGRRERRVWQQVAEGTKDAATFRDGSVVCITGGLGGLGVHVASALLQQVRGIQLVLVGRSAPTGDARQRLLALQAQADAKTGASVEYRSLDIADLDAVRKMFDEISQSRGGFNAIVHTAGVLRDCRLSAKTSETVAEVLAPKVSGTCHLDIASRGHPLDAFVLFSSAAAVLGNVGQTDYAAANAFLDAFAHERNQRQAAGLAKGRTVSIDWPLWQDGGMRFYDHHVAALTRETGMVPMRTDTGMALLFDSLSGSDGQRLVLEGEIARMRAWLPNALQPTGRRLHAPAAHAQTAQALAPEALREATLRHLMQLFAAITERAHEQLDPDETMENYGLDSIIINRLNAALEPSFPRLSRTLFFEFKTLSAICAHLLAEHTDGCKRWTQFVADEAVVSAVSEPADKKHAISGQVISKHAAEKQSSPARPAREPIAIVGISGVYPMAPDLDTYWRNLRDGRDCVGEIPADRWSLDDFYEPDPERAIELGKSYSRWGGFLEGFADFDPLFFNISPRETLNIDPQERLFLQECWRTLESAGYTRDDLKNRFGGRIGVFAGITKPGYQLYAMHASRDGTPFLPYTSFCSAANRVSYALDISGPSMPVDTMCSSSLSAIHEACEHILRGECEMAFAGGVNLYLHPNTYVFLSSQNMLSSDGRCRTFGAGGDGYVPGEGVGVVLLKRLSDAERDGDPIHGVILSTRMNHGGRTHGYTVPNPNAQAALIREAIDVAGIDASAISYIETHGTGTELGDPIEITGLQRAFSDAIGQDADGGFRCRIGGVKSNIGHLEAASGIAGLTKVLLQMRHGQCAPSLHAETLNPNIDWDQCAFEVNTRLTPWTAPSEGVPRIAGVSSFGASGTNAHIIVQEYLSHASAAERPTPMRQLERPVAVPLSARTASQLVTRARDLLAFLRDAEVAPDLAALAYTLQVGREAMEERMCCLVDSHSALIDVLQGYLDGAGESAALHIGQASSQRSALRAMTRDEDFRETVQRWVARRKLDRLAEWWVRGLEIDWRALYGADAPARLSLPTYPFARERLWIDACVSPTPPATTHATSTTLHPLLHTNVSDLHRQAYASVLTGAEPCLRDHVVGGEHILPGVAYLEMVRAAMARALPGESDGRMLEVRNTVWAQPMIVAGRHDVEITLQPQADTVRIGFSIVSRAAGDVSSDPAWQTHCEGDAAFVAAPAPESHDIATLSARMDRGEMSADALYQMFDAAGVAFGPAHRAVQAVALGHNEALARLRLPDVVSPADPAYGLHPSLMDSALQTCSCLSREAMGGNAPLLPFALDSVRVFAPCSADMYAWVRRVEVSGDRADTPLSFDIDLLDADGRVCVHMHGFTARPRAAHARNDDAVQVLVPVWERVVPACATPVPQRLAVVGDAAALHWARASFPNAQALPASAIADRDALRKQLVDGVDHVLWVAPDVFADTASGHVDMAAATAGLHEAFALAKAAIDLPHTLRWTFITRSTQAVFGGDTIVPCHAGIAGFVGSLSREYPEWDLRLLDLERMDYIDAQTCLALDAAAPVVCYAHRDGEWFRRGLAALEAPTAAHDGYRQGGTYLVVGGAGGIGVVWSRHMIERYDAQLIWIGRRPLDAEIRAKIDALAALGRAPEYIQADATDPTALHAAAERIRQSHPALHGVVHSAIDLRDRSLDQMDPVDFDRAIAAKLAATVNVDAVFGEMDLDFVLFFSSMIAFSTGAGQANYAAGTTFADSFARSLAQRRRYPVKIVNWGYWGGVGVVADDFHRQRMQQLGIGSIEAPEAMRALQRLVDHAGFTQIAVIKALDPRAIADYVLPETVGGQLAASSTPLSETVSAARAHLSLPSAQALRDDALDETIDGLATDLMCEALSAHGIAVGASFEGMPFESMPFESVPFEQLAARVPTSLARWLQTSLDIARARGEVTIRPADTLWREWASHRAVLAANPRLRARLDLMEACLRALPDILSGARAATDVIFPDASMSLVEGAYTGHLLADACNDALGQALVTWLQRQPAASRLRLLEIGAGTGGTTRNVLPRLDAFSSRIEEYAYTDLSRAFLLHAESQFRAQCPALHPRILDISRSPATQGLDIGGYDVVIATNVLHATPDMRQTLRNAKALLRPGGLILINEMTGWSLIRHLTFGLLEGWWLYEDEALREPGSPGLAIDTWQRLLACEGFYECEMVLPEAHPHGQLIVAAVADGLWRQRLPAAPVAFAPAAVAPRIEVRPTAVVAPAAATALTVTAQSAAQPAAAADTLHSQCTVFLRKTVAGVLKLDEQRIGLQQPLADYGLDSILVIGLTTQLRKTFPDIRSTVFFEARDLHDLADTLLRQYPDQANTLFGAAAAQVLTKTDSAAVGSASPLRLRTTSLAAPASSDIVRDATPVSEVVPEIVPSDGIFDVAIIGVSGRYPMANDLDTLWDNLASGRHCVSEVPSDRWDWRQHQGQGVDDPDAIYTRWGGFLDRIDQFDPLFFRISPREAKAIDPQERLFLQACYHAIEDAGYRPSTLARPEKVGVFVGAMNARYTAQPLHYSIANRVSFALDFQGPSVAVDTACSSSLSAIHFALDSLYSGQVECAIAGGVSLIVDAGHYRELTAVGMLSHGDRCRAFGAGADGFIDAEGVGAVVLKPLAQAERDGDMIHAVIKASAINAGGRTHGYTVPNPVAQGAVVAEALRRAKVDASDVTCIEAHGTGTALGDPIEIAGLCRAFETHTQERGFCAIGSLKSNFGHCESAAGIAALTKVLLQLQHGQLVPTLNADEVNPEIDFARTPFRLQQQLQPWTRRVRQIDGQSREVPRIAGISSFGAGGANAHLIVQEYLPSAARPPCDDSERLVVVPLSARTSEQLTRKVEDLLTFVERSRARAEAPALAAIAHTLQTGREAREERLAIVANTLDALVTALSRCRDHGDAASNGVDIHRGRMHRHALVDQSDSASNHSSPNHNSSNHSLPNDGVLNDSMPSTRPEAFAKAWANGVDVDWAQLIDPARRPSRLRLPVYPFAQDSYWQPVGRDTAPAAASMTVVPATLHPLLHRNVSNLARTAYEATFSADDRLASDHQLDVATFHGRVLPAAVHLEMACAALLEAVDAPSASLPAVTMPTQAVELSDTTWAAPAVFEDAIALRVALYGRKDGKAAYEIGRVDGDAGVLCQGLARRLEMAEPTRLNVQALASSKARTARDADMFYRDATQAGLEYGAAYRSLAGMWVGPDDVFVELRLPQESLAVADGLSLHPALLDGAMQAGSALMTVDAPPSLPWRLASLRVFSGPLTHAFAWIRRSRDGAFPGLDIDLCDADGRIYVELRGLSHGVVDIEDRPVASESAIEIQSTPQAEMQADSGKWVLVAPEDVKVEPFRAARTKRVLLSMED
jgi:polyketide synthase PksM